VTTIFLLSPARCNGPRAELLATSRTAHLATKLQTTGAPLGEVFAWLSALYFRGKLTYANAFGPKTTFVMAAGAGLVPPDALITVEHLRAMGDVDVESDAFVTPLRRDAKLVDEKLGGARVVLLGSIATGKYVDCLLEVFGDRLVFPATFVGRGDMSRGGLLLRAVRDKAELDYTQIAGANRHGPRPPKLAKLPRATSSRA